MDWRQITTGDTNETFVISLIKSESEGNFVFNLSNFKELWRETIDWQEILRRAKVSFKVETLEVRFLPANKYILFDCYSPKIDL